mgnify:CR=1 FL=1
MLEKLREHIGMAIEISDHITATAIQRLADTFDRDLGTVTNGDAIPPGWHGIFCIGSQPTAALSDAGLPRPSALLPEIPLPRRVFGGARITFHAPLRVGDQILCRSEVADIKQRSGAAGEMVIVILRHSFSSGGTLRVVEEQDIVHLPAAPPASGAPSAPTLAPTDAALSATIRPDTRMLFRFSALTFNSHRIHYDYTYTTEVEHLPALMVQGKLQAMLLLGLAEKLAPAGRLQTFSYRSVRPLFADRPFTIGGNINHTDGVATLWAADAEGALAQSASARIILGE